jgi:thiol:disulfide interchange protein DsbD
LGNMGHMRAYLLRLFALISLSLGSSFAQLPSSAVVTTPQVRAELVAHAPQGIQAGQALTLGLLLSHQPGWHTYWLNPGDSGLATQLNWTLPPGLQAGNTVWPLPQMIPVADMVNHGFEGQVLLAAPVQIDKGFVANAASLKIQLKASWLVCKQECIPQEGKFEIQLPVAGSTASHSAAFEALLAAQPQALQPSPQTAQVSDKGLALRIQGLPSSLQGKPLQLFAESTEVLASGLGAGSLAGQWQSADYVLQAPLHAMRSSEPSKLGLLVVDGSGEQAKAWHLNLSIQGTWPPEGSATLAKTSALVSPPSLQTVEEAASWAALLAALLGAFLGGLLLNLMPCVLPVLAIKVLSLSQHHQSVAQRRTIGLTYALGVIASMLGLALLVAGLRASGQQLGWGFQLQSPLVVSALALLFTLIALNLLGVLQVNPAWSSGLAAQWVRHPLADAFLSGVLAVVVAAPCTAPFMGASVGIALTLPLWQGLLIFVALGVGLALPFTLLSWVPAWARWLPRPGIWMERLRQLLAFPMLATVVWLLWVLGQQTSIDGMAVMLAALLLVSACVWALGLSGKAKWLGLGLWGGLLLLLVLTWGPLVWKEAPAITDKSSSSADWQAWSPEREAAAVKAGQTVFIDFTAAWCVTCQVNKQTTLRDAKVLQAFADKKVLLLRADWTRRDPAITQALGRLGRSGVPVYVLLVPQTPPNVLSEVLSPDLVLQALAGL